MHAPPPPRPSAGLPSRRRFLSAAGLTALVSGVPGGAALARTRQDFEASLDESPPAPALEAGGPGSMGRHYDLAPGLSYLNHASIGTVPRAVREALAGYQATCETNPWLHVWGEVWTAAVEDVRRAAAELLGVAAVDVAITQNTTEAFNLLAQGLSFEAGDEVLFSDLNHVGASRAFQVFGPRRGFVARRFALPVLEVPRLTEDEWVSLHVEALGGKTRLLVLPHVDNVVGVRLPIQRIAAEARERGVRWIAVDGAQVPGAMPVDLASLGVDFYATSAHKWIQSPKGMGLFWAAERAREALSPFRVTWGQDSWAGSARIYEDYGTRDPSRLLALGDALAFQARIDPAQRAAHLSALRERARERCRAAKLLSWRSPESPRLAGPLFAVGIEGAEPSELAATLFDAERVVLRPFATLGLLSLRFSPNLEASIDDLDRAFDALERCLA